MINIDISSIQESHGDSVTGRISFCFQDDFFPEENWNDKVFPIINWWGDAIVNFVDRTEDVEFLFMDGSFNVKIFSNNDDSTVEMRNGSRVLKQLVYKTEDLKKEIVDGFLNSSEKLLSYIRDNKLFSKESEKLELNYRTLMNR